MKKKSRTSLGAPVTLLLVLAAINGFLYFIDNIDALGIRTSALRNAGIAVTELDRYVEYTGADYIELDNGVPGFTETDYKTITGENYSKLDHLGRCGAAVAMLDSSMMPIAEREEIDQIRPSGWKQKKYEGIIDSRPPYLYNRCHLIAYALTGQNANERNLITGTRYFNTIAMLPFEKQVMSYLDESDHHVLYRVTPYFRNDELVARGVEMEAYSVEDNGAGVCFHVFVYNHQPGVVIDYKTGESRLAS
ncbi:MAG: DNA/RNA non-specific endonuclease [Blautia sp.]|nr:DNA/RNA non-specific endonuclease [Blautia sp.]